MIARRRRGSAWIAAISVFASGTLLGCGSGDRSGAVGGPPTEGGRVALAEARSLQAAFGEDRQRPLVLPASKGAVVIGGAAIERPSTEDRGRVVPSTDVALVTPDGHVSALAPLPWPLADLTGAAVGNDLVVAGLRCREGRTPSDAGELDCVPGDAVLLRYDSDNGDWSEKTLPSEAPAVPNRAGAQRVQALNNGMAVYSTGSQHFLSDQAMSVWKRLQAPFAGVCVTAGTVLSYRWSAEAAGGLIESSMPPDGPFDLEMSRLDHETTTWHAVAAPPRREVASVGTEGTCTPEVGLVVRVLTGGRAGSLLWYRPDRGWGVVDDANGAGFSDVTALDSSTLFVSGFPGVVESLVLDTADGTTVASSLPAAAEVIGRVGEGRLLVLNGPAVDIVETP